MSSQCTLYEEQLTEAIQQESDEFERQVKIVSDTATKEGESLEDEAPDGVEVAFGVDIKVDSKLVTWSINLPKIKLEDKEIGSWDVPEFTVENKEIIFHTPSTRTELKVVSRYPEVKCELRGVRTRCRTEWKEIKTHVLVPFQQKQKIIIGVPKVEMKTQKVIMGLPEVKPKPFEFKFHIPVFKIENVKVQTREMKKKAQRIQRDAEQKIEDEKAEFKAELVQEITPIHTNLFDCLKQEAVKEIETGIILIDSQISSSADSIDSLRRANVPADHEAYKKIAETKQLLEQEKIKLDQQKMTIIKNLENSQKESLMQILNGMK